MKKFNIKIKSHDRTISAFEQESLAQALVRQGILIRSDCGGKGTCQKCRVTTGTKSRLACKTKVKHDLAVDIPPGSLTSPDIISKPPIKLPTKYMAGDTSLQNEQEYAVAVDLGTTTIAAYLVGLTSQTFLSSLSVKNPQSLFGDDVMARITRTMEDETAVATMQAMVVTAIEWGINSICQTSSLCNSKIKKILVVGNPTMIHLLLKKHPKSIGVYPYQPVFTEEQTIKSGCLGFSFHQDINLITLPLVSGFLGSDILAAAIAIDFLNLPAGSLLIDIGTNGELLLKGQDKIFAASCATGPAFEGALLACGMTAGPGAVYQIESDNSSLSPGIRIIDHETGKAKALGICGSGVISAISFLLKAGILRSDGRFDENCQNKNLKGEGAKKRYMLVEPEVSGNKEGVYLTQKDIRTVQMAKAAVTAGIGELCRCGEIDKPARIYIAGAFGNYVNTEDLIAIGMLPKVDTSKIKTVGNAAGAGAVLSLLDEEYSHSLQRIKEQITVVDLNANPEFENKFITALRLSLAE